MIRFKSIRLNQNQQTNYGPVIETVLHGEDNQAVQPLTLVNIANLNNRQINLRPMSGKEHWLQNTSVEIFKCSLHIIKTEGRSNDLFALCDCC